MSVKRDYLVNTVVALLETAILKKLTIKLIGKMSANWMAWFVWELYDKFRDKIVIPLVKTAIRKGLRMYDEHTGEIVKVAFQKAVEEENDQGILDAIMEAEK